MRGDHHRSGRSAGTGVLAGIALAALLGVAAAASWQAEQGGSLARLRNEIERLAGLAGGEVGVGLIHLQSGSELYVRGDEPFPMASTYRLPIAVQLLSRVDRGEIDLQKMVELTPADLHPGSGTLSELFDDPGIALSLRNLLELMLLISDNSATDIVLREAGGGEAVSRRMAELGFERIDVDRPTVELIADWLGVEGLGEAASFDLSDFRQRTEALSEEQGERAIAHVARAAYDYFLFLR